MKRKNILPIFAAVLTAIVVLASCQEDFSNFNSGVIDQDIDLILDESSTVISYSRKLTPVQTNGLPSYQLGVYNDPVYGQSVANFMGQPTINVTDPVFPDSIVLDSVIMYIPFFSQSTTTDEGTTYTLDSVFGNSPVDISIFESNFFLRDLDPDSGFEEPQNYYSNQGTTFDNFMGDQIGFAEGFVPTDEGTIVKDVLDNDSLIGPGLRIALPKEFFQEKIIDNEGNPELSNNNNFKEFFRGVYMKVDPVGGGDNRFMFNSAAMNITLYYPVEVEVTNEDGSTSTEVERRQYQLTFEGINVNTFEGTIPAEIEQQLFNPNTTQGEETLYLTGSSTGVVSIIELFGDDADGNGVADELDDLRDKEWLINDASLMFYVDQAKVQGGAAEPDRIKIFDISNQNVLIDYQFDFTAGEEAINAITTHLGPLERGSDDTGEFYRIRITNHLSNIINRDSTNVPLGLMVTQNALLTEFLDTETLQAPGIEAVPTSTVLARQGTVLHGNNSPMEAKRLKLQIYYTDPNN